jgi:ribbon-helix-helix CopG family protein
MAKIRLNIEVSRELAELVDTLARTEDTTRSEIVRRGLSVLKAYKEQREAGRPHLGFTKDPQRLDAEVLGILNSAAPAAHAPAPSPVHLVASGTPATVVRAQRTPPSGPLPVSMEAAMSRWSPHAIK